MGGQAKVKEDVQSSQDFIYVIDYPTSERLSDRTVNIEGWVVSTDGRALKGLRLCMGGSHKALKLLERKDVADAHPELPEKHILKSGFKAEIEFMNEKVSLEADFGDGFITVREFGFVLYTDVSSSVYNEDLASNWADHVDLLDAKQAYYHEPAQENKVVLKKDSPKTIAFYLPQFHPIPENDHAWGKGFTEWTNVASSVPRFVGHRQPYQPADFGYYDLRVEDVLREQIDLARKHGIYGFCFYYYWFSGKRVLEMPIDSFLKHKEWNFNFMICWANENWTKRWDGMDDEIILEQKFAQDDPTKFIMDVEPILIDKRYIRVDNKPVLVVYRPEKLKLDTYVKVWREYFKKKHNLDLHLVTVWGGKMDDPKEYGFDASIQFVPGALGLRPDFAGRYLVDRKKLSKGAIDLNHSCSVIDYRKVTKDLIDELNTDAPKDFPLYKCVMPGWDNDARRKGQKSTVYANDSPDIYYQWLKEALSKQDTTNQFTFLNAWNEWAEGAILEPSAHYGHAILNRTSDAISGRTPSFQGMRRTAFASVAALVQITDAAQLKASIENLKKLNISEIDVYVVLGQADEQWKKYIKKVLPNAKIMNLSGRGKDVMPLLHIARRAEVLGYDSILRIMIDGSQSKNFLDFEELLLNEEKLKNIVNLASDNPIYIGSNGENMPGFAHGADALRLVRDITGRECSGVTPETVRMLDSNFWASLPALSPVISYHFLPEDLQAVIKKNHKNIEQTISAAVWLATLQTKADHYIARDGLLIPTEDDNSRGLV